MAVHRKRDCLSRGTRTLGVIKLRRNSLSKHEYIYIYYIYMCTCINIDNYTTTIRYIIEEFERKAWISRNFRILIFSKLFLGIGNVRQKSGVVGSRVRSWPTFAEFIRSLIIHLYILNRNFIRIFPIL